MPDIIMPFGRYKGWKIENVPAEHLLDWWHLENIQPGGEVRKWIAEHFEDLYKSYHGCKKRYLK